MINVNNNNTYYNINIMNYNIFLVKIISQIIQFICIPINVFYKNVNFNKININIRLDYTK